MKLSDQDKRQRGIDADALLKAPLIIEAFARLETATVDRIAGSDRTDIAAMRALMERLRVIRDLKQELITIRTDGEEIKYRQEREANQ